MPRMTRKQALARLQAVADKAGWIDLQLAQRNGVWVAEYWAGPMPRTQYAYIKYKLTDLVAAFERLAQ